MNGFDVIAKGYRKAADEGKITQEQAEKKARLFDFLGTCNLEDLSALYGSGAFNEFMRSEISITIDELKEEGILTDKQAKIARERFYQNMTEGGLV